MTTVDKDAFFKMVGYEPHDRQKLFHADDARFRVPVCGRRFGKSTMAARDLEPELLLPNRRYWIVGPTYNLGEKEFRVIWDDMIVKQGLGRDKRVKRSYNLKQGDMYIEFPWKTRVEVRSATHPESLVGDALHGVIMSEAAKHDKETWERYIRASLADYRGWATFPTTPEGHNWLYQLWMQGQNPDIPYYSSWRFPSWENPAVYPGGRDDPEIQLLERTTTAEWFMQEIGADFASFVGRIYGEFDEQTHVRKLQYNPALPSYIAFDFGFVDPLVALEFQTDPFDNVYVWREHYLSYATLQEHVAILKGRDQPDGYRLDVAFGDAADPAAANYISDNLVACMADPEAKKNWRQGVDLVKRFLKEYATGEYDDFERPITSPKLFVDHSCENLIREFKEYRTKDGVISRESSSTGAARKQDDHALDALRYGLMHIYELGAKHHLTEVDNAVNAFGESESYFQHDSAFDLNTEMVF